MKREHKFFLAGGAFGLTLFIILIFLPIPEGKGPVTNLTTLREMIFHIIYFPGKIVVPLDNLIHWTADITGGNFDKGLGFDGPLAWLEWFSIILALVLWYGFIFMIIEKIFRKKR